jgi:signal transduction histidine kinase
VAEHAQAHGGDAWVEDRPGGGARFIATFGEAL